MVDWQAINLGLDILIKIVFLVIFVASLYLMKRMDDLVQTAERSAESIEDTAEDIGRLVRFARKLPFTGKGDES
jgi:uncharacterized protein YpmB